MVKHEDKDGLLLSSKFNACPPLCRPKRSGTPHLKAVHRDDPCIKGTSRMHGGRSGNARALTGALLPPQERWQAHDVEYYVLDANAGGGAKRGGAARGGEAGMLHEKELELDAGDVSETKACTTEASLVFPPD
jgi:hypothetical protein